MILCFSNIILYYCNVIYVIVTLFQHNFYVSDALLFSNVKLRLGCAVRFRLKAKLSQEVTNRGYQHKLAAQVSSKDKAEVSIKIKTQVRSKDITVVSIKLQQKFEAQVSNPS